MDKCGASKIGYVLKFPLAQKEIICITESIITPTVITHIYNKCVPTDPNVKIPKYRMPYCQKVP